MRFGFLLTLAAVAGAILYRVRLVRGFGPPRAAITDDMVRRIEEEGRVEMDEPLDIEMIKEEEARFWDDQPWEETEEW